MCAVTDMLQQSDTVSLSVSPRPVIRWYTIQGVLSSFVDECLAFLLFIIAFHVLLYACKHFVSVKN